MAKLVPQVYKNILTLLIYSKPVPTVSELTHLVPLIVLVAKLANKSFNIRKFT